MSAHELVGHVDVVNKFMIAGWALHKTDEDASPEIDIVQVSKTLVSVRTCFQAATLRSELGLPPSKSGSNQYAWRVHFPLSAGINPNTPFSVLFRKTGELLARGKNCIIRLVERIDPDAKRDLASSFFFFPSYQLDDQKTLTLSFRAFGVSAEKSKICLDVGSKRVEMGVTPLGPEHERDYAIYSGTGWEGNLRLNRDAFPISVGISGGSTSNDERLKFHSSLRSVYFPRAIVKSAALRFPLPSFDNVRRVSGPSTNDLRYLVSGSTTFRQLNSITMRYFHRKVTEFSNIVDWGVGCARVIRHFWEMAPDTLAAADQGNSIIGYDIDKVNIDWCRQHMNGHGEYELLDRDGGFPLPDGSVDLLYGISVMTHLSEYHGHKWLEEIRRVVRPGGAIILTTHGEACVYTWPHHLALPFIEEFGFFDGIPDGALGNAHRGYYRATYHSRGYLKKYWAKYFDILDVIPATNAFVQDFVVLAVPPN